MKKILFLLVSFCFLLSCNKSKSSSTESPALEMKMAPPAAMDKSGLTNDVTTDSTSSQTSGIALQGTMPGQNPDWDKKIIKTANLRIEVKDFKQYADYIHKNAKQYGGYIANEEQNQSDEKLESSISIKVPVDQFENLMNQFSNSSEKVIEKKITTEDVTGEVVDTRSRLQAKEQMRLKYLEFLKQAKNMEDVLKVQSEINNIQEEIESASGRVNYLSHQSAFSTINLTWYQPLAGYNPSNDEPGFFTRTANAFKRGFSYIGEIFIGFVAIWPLIVLVFVAWIFYKKHAWRVAAAKQK